MSKLPPPINIEGMSLEAINEAIQDCHDWPGMKHPSDHHRLAMRAACEALRLEGDLEAAQQEIADLKRGGVMVPEWPLDGHDDRLDEIRCWKGDPIRGVVEWNAINRTVAWMRSRLRTIPADRVLGEGDAKVSAKAIEQASKTLDSLVVTSWARGDHEEKMVTELCAAFRPIACAATCAQPTQEPTT